MIVVTGASGQLGSAVVEKLLEQTNPSKIIGSVKKPSEAGTLKAFGVDVRRGDYDDPESLVQSFKGASRLLLISASGIDHEKRSAQHRNAIDAAKRAGIGHIFYTSLLPGEDSVAYVMKAHIDTERYLNASGLSFTILRNSAYAEGWDIYLGKSGEVAVPADGPISWVSKMDLADGTAKLLFAGGHEGETLNLTGSTAIDVKGVATFQKRPFRIVSAEEYVANLKDEDHARKWVSTYFGMARGEWAKVDPFLGKLLGKPLRTIEEVLAQ
jgi:uncharacterized protein YbjT (DUF2867 family)